MVNEIETKFANNICQQFREIMKAEKDFGMKSESEYDVQYPTGFLNIDYMNGQRIFVRLDDGRTTEYDSIGIVDGSINMFIGRSGCGKSTLAEQMASNIIRRFPLSGIFEDSIEGGVTARRNEILTKFSPEEYHLRTISRNHSVNIETFYKRIKAIHDLKMNNKDNYRYDTGLLDSRGNHIYKFQPTVYILDSLAMLRPEKMTQEEEMSGQMSTTAAAKAIADLFRRITPIIKASNIIVFVINHITQKIELNPFVHTKGQNIFLKQGESLPGGVTPLYLANNVFRLDDNTKVTDDKEFGIFGYHVDVSLVKSRTNKSGSTTEMIFNQDYGFDSTLSLYMTLKNNKMINGAGAYLYIGDRSDKKFNQKNLKEKIATDEEFRNIFIDACYSVLHNSLKSNEEYESINNYDVSDDVLNKIYGINEKNLSIMKN